MERRTILSGSLIAAFPLQVLASPVTATPDLVKSILILAFFGLPVMIAAWIARYEPDLPDMSSGLLEKSQPDTVTAAIGPEEADEFIRQPAMEVVVDGEPDIREPIRPPVPRKKQHAA